VKRTVIGAPAAVLTPPGTTVAWIPVLGEIEPLGPSAHT
jgi:hypothetical protein